MAPIMPRFWSLRSSHPLPPSRAEGSGSDHAHSERRMPALPLCWMPRVGSRPQMRRAKVILVRWFGRRARPTISGSGPLRSAKHDAGQLAIKLPVVLCRREYDDNRSGGAILRLPSPLTSANWPAPATRLNNCLRCGHSGCRDIFLFTLFARRRCSQAWQNPVRHSGPQSPSGDWAKFV